MEVESDDVDHTGDFALVGEDILHDEEIIDTDDNHVFEFDEEILIDNDEEPDFYTNDHFEQIDQEQYEQISRTVRPDFPFQGRIYYFLKT